MTGPSAQRTLVKSPPELWAEISDAEALARHLGELGEIRITRLDPETTVAWEGDRVRGTVALEASGWGTKVTLVAAAEQGAVEPEDDVAVDPEPAAVAATPSAPEPRRGFFARLFGRPAPPRPAPAPAPAPPAPIAEASPTTPAVVTEPSIDPDELVAVLTAVLDDLGAAHHRPFSR